MTILGARELGKGLALDATTAHARGRRGHAAGSTRTAPAAPLSTAAPAARPTAPPPASPAVWEPGGFRGDLRVRLRPCSTHESTETSARAPLLVWLAGCKCTHALRFHSPTSQNKPPRSSTPPRLRNVTLGCVYVPSPTSAAWTSGRPRDSTSSSSRSATALDTCARQRDAGVFGSIGGVGRNGCTPGACDARPSRALASRALPRSAPRARPRGRESAHLAGLVEHDRASEAPVGGEREVRVRAD